MRGSKAKELRTLAQIAALEADRPGFITRRLTVIRHPPKYVYVSKEQTLAQKIWNAIKGVTTPPMRKIKVEPLQFVEAKGTLRWYYHFLKRQYLQMRRTA